MTAVRPVLIVGAGIAGLTLAVALARRGIESTLVERRAVIEEVGAGIQLGPNATHALALIGIADRLAPLAAQPSQLAIHARSDRPLAIAPLAGDLDQRFGAPYWTLLRTDLARALETAASQLPAITIERSVHVSALDETTDAVSVSAGDRRVLGGRCLVGADGVWSTVRRALAPAHSPEFTGEWAYRALIAPTDLPPTIDRDRVNLWMAPNCHLVCYPVDRGRLINVVVIIADHRAVEGWDHHASASEVAGRASRLPPPARTMIGAASQWRAHPLYRAKPICSVGVGRLILIGDASHPVRPYFAQGAGMAIEDAVELADAIARDGPLPTSLQAVAKHRLPRVTRLADASERNGQIYHLGGAAAIARDATLRLLPAASLLRRYDWLYGYRVRWHEAGDAA